MRYAPIILSLAAYACGAPCETYTETAMRVGGDCPAEHMPMMTESATVDGCGPKSVERTGFVGECRFSLRDEGDERTVRWECLGEPECVAVYRLTRLAENDETPEP